MYNIPRQLRLAIDERWMTSLPLTVADMQSDYNMFDFPHEDK